MTILYLDNSEIDLVGNSGISINYSHADIDRLTDGNTKGSFSFEITIPATAANKKAFYFPELALEESFDDTTEKTARLEVDGAVVLQGFARIKSTTIKGNIVNYKVVLYEGNSSWINEVKDLSIQDIDYSAKDHIYDKDTIDGLEVIQDNETLVTYPVINFGTNIKGEDDWSVEDRMPAFRVWRVLQDIFKAAGYSINSDFINGEFFKKLWFTSEEIPQRSKAEVEAHKFNVVVSDEYLLSSGTNGNDPWYNKEFQMPWKVGSSSTYYNANDSRVINLDSTNAKFNCQFKGNMAFAWNYSIGSRSTSAAVGKQAVDLDISIIRDRGSVFTSIADASVNSIDSFEGGIKIKHNGGLGWNAGTDIRLSGMAISDYDGVYAVVDSGYNYVVVLTQFKGSTSGTITGGYNRQDKTIVAEDKINIPKVPKNSQINVSDTLRTKSITVEKGDNYYCVVKLLTNTNVNHYVGVGSGVNIQPPANTFTNEVFRSFVKGSPMVISDLIPDISQREFVQDIRTMFNLYFHTSEIDKEITIEPRDEFFTTAAEDWTDKIDLSKAIQISHLGNNLGKTIKFKYADDSNDKYIHFKEKTTNNNDEWLSREFTNTNKNAKDSTTNKVVKNFAPSIMGQGITTANSARIPIIWDSETDNIPDSKIKKWKSRMLYYKGRTLLPNGETWRFEGEVNRHYPEFNINYDSGNPLTKNDNSLAWENRGGQHGLVEKHYINTLNTINTSRKYVAYIKLDGRDVNNLDFRIPKYISIDGDGAYYHLQKINGYTPEKVGTFKCEFIKVVNPVPRVDLRTTTDGSITPPFIEDEIVVPYVFPKKGDGTIYMVHTEKTWQSTESVPAGEWVDIEATTDANVTNANNDINYSTITRIIL